MITARGRYQNLADGSRGRYALPIQAPVIRLADAKPVQLGHVRAQADGAWRLYIFADQRAPTEPGSRARDLCEFLASESLPSRPLHAG